MHIERHRLGALVLSACLCPAAPASTPAAPARVADSEHPAALAAGRDKGELDEARIPPGTPIRRIVLVQENIFDLSQEDEDNWLYRTMNRLHIVTRPATVRQQLLFHEGEIYDPRLVEESARILRENKYLYDATIEPALNSDGELEIDVVTRDVWTLTPEISYSRGGGENKTILGLEESNLFGTGHRLMVAYEDDVDRRGTVFGYEDRQLFGTWTSLGFSIANNSDGHSNVLSLVKPFYALDARRAWGLSYFDDDRRSTYYDLGDEAAEYRHQRQYYTAFGGISAGLNKGWVRRWTYGFAYDNNEFGEVRDPELPAVVPANRKLVYPFAGFELLEDRYEISMNHNQIDRAEDFYLGTRLAVTLGWSDTAFGADRDALIYGLSGNYSLGSLKDQALLLSGNFEARQEDGSTENSTLDLVATYYWRQSDKRLFFAHLMSTLGHDLDGDNIVEIGGDNGLRGYPLRYQSGDSSLILSVEQRYFTDWYPWRLFRVGGAVFADIGRVWGPNALGTESLGWLRDVGIGLRLAPTRLGTTKVFHVDVAFPLDGTDDIDDVQILVRAKRGF
ncbi:MAG TPA: hypothetical protein VFY03_00085 [Woeseiaceae bacterium]|nr:hypothetical protein [Woeseiaceae bacterium]